MLPGLPLRHGAREAKYSPQYLMHGYFASAKRTETSDFRVGEKVALRQTPRILLLVCWGYCAGVIKERLGSLVCVRSEKLVWDLMAHATLATSPRRIHRGRLGEVWDEG